MNENKLNELIKLIGERIVCQMICLLWNFHLNDVYTMYIFKESNFDIQFVV